MTTSTFDATFDYTFNGLIPDAPTIPADACALPGLNVGWLSPTGWAYWLFTGNTDTDKVSAVVGATFESAGLTRDTQRKGGKVLIVRAGGLTPADADVISTLYDSIAVYAFVKNPAGNVIAVPVNVEPGSNAIGRDGQGRLNMDAKLTFPTNKSFRA